MWGLVVCVILLIIFAPKLIALFGVVTIPIIIICAGVVFFIYMRAFSKFLRVNKLEKQHRKKFRNKCEELKTEYTYKTTEELETLLVSSYENYFNNRIPSKYEYGTIEYEEERHNRSMKHEVIFKACEELLNKRECEKLKKDCDNKTLHELREMKNQEIESYDSYIDNSEEYRLAHNNLSYSLNSYKRKRLNKIRLNAFTELICEKGQ